MKMTIKLVFGNGKTKTLYPTRKSKITRNPVLDKFKSAYLRVEYQKGLENSGTYFNRKDFIRALNAFTEPLLLEYLKGGSFE